jgi:vacuolar protein sorting-associated protein VTA1
LQKNLHKADQATLEFTTNIMARLEEYKAVHGNEDVLADTDVGRAYVENFAQDTFERGEKVLRANRVKR